MLWIVLECLAHQLQLRTESWKIVMSACWNFESSENAQEHELHKSWSGKIFLYHDLEIIMENDVESNVKFPAHYL